MERAYGTSGSAPFNPALLLSSLVYGYSIGAFSSRKLENVKIPDGMNLPEEIVRREDLINAIAEAKTKIEGRAKERFEQEQVKYQD